LIQQDFPDNQVIIIGLKGLENYLEFGASMSRKQATNNKFLIKMKQNGAVKKIKESMESQEEEVSEVTLGIWDKYLKKQFLRRKFKLKKAILCFRNERHSLFGIFKNEKKRLDV